jgi:hypothetical protein
VSSTCHGGHGTGTGFTYAELEGLWIKAGGPKSLAPTMAAIAEAESGGCSAAFNPSGASGLWQILGNPFPGNAFDPGTNAKMAVAKYKSQGLGAWVTFTSGAYKQFMNGATTPNLNVPGAGGGGGSSGIDTTAAIDMQLCALGWPGIKVPILGTVGGQCLLSKTQARAMLGGLTIGGGALILGVGLALLAVYGLGRNRTVQTVVSLIPGGGVAAGMARSGGRAAAAAGARAPATAAAAGP